jgi:ketosteroid isomerase-like protein
MLHVCLSALLSLYPPSPVPHSPSPIPHPASPIPHPASRIPQAGPGESPGVAVNRLLDADRGFSAAGADKPAVESISAMFAEDVTVPAPGNVFVQGRSKAIEALKSNADNLASRVTWAPIRGGISADGTHGFTFGFMTMNKADGSSVPLKYLAYWVKGPHGWRVAAYRRRPRPDATAATAPMPPSLPPRLVEPSADAARAAAFGDSLAAAEKAFSDEAQTIGIGAAFAKHGRPDAVNMGGPKVSGFVVGAEAIGRDVGAGQPTDSSGVEWSADRVLIASSGDLGITFGSIRIKKPEPGTPAAIPFFTIWRRDSPSEPWRYIAE